MDSYDDDGLFNVDMSVEDFKLKLNLGANPNIKNEYGKTVLIYLIEYSKFDVLFDKVKVILDDKRIDLNKCDINGFTPLYRLIYRTIEQKESLEVFDYILKDKRTKVNIKNDFEKAELIFCVTCFNLYKKVRVDLFERLLEEKRINVNLISKYNETVLDELFNKFNYLKERKECLKILLKRKEINLNKQDRKGNTVLMRLLLKFEKKEEEEDFDYFELKDIIIIILIDSRTNILIKNRKGESVRNITNDIDFLKIIAQKLK